MTTRPVEQSLFPNHRPDRPTGRLAGSVQSGTNADLIAAIAPLYLEGRTVMDVTYGRGGWWTRYRPSGLITHDLALDGVDFRALPESDRSVDVVCFDPPYVSSGTTPQIIESSHRHTAGDFRDRYGLKPMDRRDLIGLFRGGMSEAARVARQWVLAKCGDYTAWHSFHLGHLDMMEAARAAGLGDPWDLIVHHTGAGPGGWNIWQQVRARRHHSYLLVFAKEVPA